MPGKVPPDGGTRCLSPWRAATAWRAGTES